MLAIGGFFTMVQRRVLPRGSGVQPLAGIVLALRQVLAALFLWAGSLKLSHPRAFAHVIDEYGIIPGGWPLVIAAFAIPTLELLAGIGVLLDCAAGYQLMLGMLTVFIGVLWFGILNDLDVDCGCFSLEERRGQASLRAAFARDWVMAAGVAACLLARRRLRRAINPRSSNNREEQE